MTRENNLKAICTDICRKYFDPDEDGSYDRYRHLEDHYDGTMVKSGFEDIRGNVPGEPGADYPVYTRVPETRFSCENRAQGNYHC